MALSRAFGAVLSGVSAQIVTVEVDHSRGLPGVGIVGLPDASVSESRWRVKTAINNSNLSWPRGRITVSLSPAEVRKHGSGLDLAIAMALLGSSGQVSEPSLKDTVFVGELGLDGSIRRVLGALPATIAAAQRQKKRVVVPWDNAQQCQLVPGVEVRSSSSLIDLIAALEHGSGFLPLHREPVIRPRIQRDLADVMGQFESRYALEVCAAGGHNLSMIGAPGVGKTMLAERLCGILPDLDPHDSLEVTAIHAISGSLIDNQPVVTPPFESPHHAASLASMVGSVQGQRVHPGAITRAHKGVLFLDEAPEFQRNVLEALRQPTESGTITLHRAQYVGNLPAAFQLVTAANPCPCGNALPSSPQQCSCESKDLQKYAQRLSGPLRDRIDIRVVMAGVNGNMPGESTRVVKDRVALARDRAAHRFAGREWSLNAHIPARELQANFPIEDSATELLNNRLRESDGLRGVHRVLRLAWTSADLAGRDRPNREDVAVALHLRNPDGRG